MVGADRAQQARGDAQPRPSRGRRAPEAHPRRPRTSSSRASGRARSSAGTSARTSSTRSTPVIVRTSGFGQTGPYSSLPGFGTLAESISGYAYINGWPDGRRRCRRSPSPTGSRPSPGPSRRCSRCGGASTPARARPGDRPGDLRAAVLDARPAGARLRPARHRPGRTGNAAPFTAPRNAYRRRTDAGSGSPRAPSRSRSG